MAKSNATFASFSLSDVKIDVKSTEFKGYFQIDKYTLRHKISDNEWSHPVTREVFERGHAVAVIPYDPIADKVILIEQFRIGALAANYNPWLLEIPAGIIEEGQHPDEVAIRETFEETGCKPKSIELIADYLVTPGACSETIHLYYAEIDSTEAVLDAGLEEEGEYIKVLQMPLQEALNSLKNGHMHNSAGIIALQWLELNKSKIRKEYVI